MAARGTWTVRPFTVKLCGSPAARGQTPPGLVERGSRCGIGRHVPNRRAGELFQPEIGARVELHDVHMLLR